MNTQAQINVFQGQDVNFIENNGDILFTAEEVGRHLGYSNPSEAINRIFKRNSSELRAYSTSVKLTAVDEKQRLTRAFTEEGVYILSMLARTSRAKKFRASVAQLLRRIRKQHLEQAIELAQQSGFAQGVDHARALPAVQVMQKQAYLDGMNEGRALYKKQDRFTRLQKIVGYIKRGFTHREIAAVLGCSRSTVQYTLRRAALLVQQVSA